MTPLDEIRRLNAIDALDLILERYGLAFVLTVLVERSSAARVRGCLDRIAELQAAGVTGSALIAAPLPPRSAGMPPPPSDPRD